MFLASALALACGIAARANDTTVTTDRVPPVTGTQGLLGQEYGTLTYSYIDLDAASTHGDQFSFSLNQPLDFGLDGILSYEYARSRPTGSILSQNTLGGALRSFCSSYNWGKPYAEAGAGYTWARYAGSKDNSFVWHAAAGVEFQVVPRATVTPFLEYADAPDLAGGNRWNFGVKGNYWIDSQWSVTVGLARDDNQNTAFTVGTHFRY